MMKRFGVTTIARWLGEEMPLGVAAYIEYRGRLFELVRLEAGRGKIRPILRTLADRFGEFRPDLYVTLETRVILSLSEKLAGVPADNVEDKLAPAASNSWGMNISTTQGQLNRITAPVPNENVHGLYCG